MATSSPKDSQRITGVGKDLLTKVEFDSGQALFEETDPAEALFVIDSGAVSVTRTVHGLSCHIESLGVGDVLGEAALFSEANYRVRAVALEPTRCLRVVGDQFGEVVKRSPDIAFRIMRKLALRLIHAHFRLSNFALRSPMARLMHQLLAEIERAEGESTIVPLPYDLPEVLSLERGAVDDLMRRLIREGLVELDDEGGFHVVDAEAYDRYLRYLELDDRFYRIRRES